MKPEGKYKDSQMIMDFLNLMIFKLVSCSWASSLCF